MRKYSADFILNPEGKLVSDHMLVADDQGMIIDLVQGGDSDSVYYKGILSPGFINTHCHLELSYLQNQIAEGTGLDGFIRDIVKTRNDASPEISPAISKADRLMWDQGIQGVGDICNTDHTFKTKESGKIRYHSFIELFNFKPEEALVTFNAGLSKYDDAIASHKNASIIPHAPYSVTRELFQLIKEHHKKNNSPWCIHNQESASENELFLNGEGALWNCFSEMGVDMNRFIPTGKNSLISICNYFPKNTNLLLVHNSFTSKSDIDFLKSESHFKNTWLALCVKANLYIEKQIPDIKMLHEAGCKITIGTDSLASNDTLSVLEEIKVIHKAFPTLPVADLLQWATKNGAAYFGWNDLGAFNKKTMPGILCISNADTNYIASESTVTRIN